LRNKPKKLGLFTEQQILCFNLRAIFSHDWPSLCIDFLLAVGKVKFGNVFLLVVPVVSVTVCLQSLLPYNATKIIMKNKSLEKKNNRFLTFCITKVK